MGRLISFVGRLRLECCCFIWFESAISGQPASSHRRCSQKIGRLSRTSTGHTSPSYRVRASFEGGRGTFWGDQHAAARDDETRDATGATDATDATDATAPRVIGVGPGSTEPEPELALTLTESDTFVLFRAPGRVVPRDDPAAEALERRGAA